MKIKREQIIKIIDIMRDTFGIEDLEFLPDYSGRGMYGRSCVGFVVLRSEQVIVGAALTLALADDDLDLVIEFLRQIATDSMGLSEIVYFPNMQLEG